MSTRTPFRMFLDFIMGRDMLNSKSKSPLLTPRIGQNKMEWIGIKRIYDSHPVRIDVYVILFMYKLI